MISDLKKAIKLLSYGLNKKAMLFCALFFLLIGSLEQILMVFSGQGAYSFSSMLFVMAGIYFFQLEISVSVSRMVQSTGMKRKIQTVYPVLLTYIITVILYSVVVVFQAFALSRFAAITEELKVNTLMMSLVIALIFVYFGVCFKHYLISTLVFFPVIMVISGIMGYLGSSGTAENLPGSGLPFAAVALIGFAVISLGALMSYGLGILFYHHNLSEAVFKGMLRKAMK